MDDSEKEKLEGASRKWENAAGHHSLTTKRSHH